MFALLQAEFIPRIPLDSWTETAVDWMTDNFGWVFGPLKVFLDVVVESLAFILIAPPALLTIAVLTAIALFMANWRVALFTALGLLFMIMLDLWDATMFTLALILAATVACVILGVPLGIAAAKNQSLQASIRPVLDIMQTMPPFVYLVPFVVVLSIGNPPALVATIIFAMPPAVRLTMLGIEQVPAETVEAAQAFGSTPWQTLFKVELPLALPTIMAGVNQVIMLSLSMVVIAALAGADGLGQPVVTGLSSLDVGQALIGGLGIVVIAIILDRTTRTLARREPGAKKS